MFGTKVVEKIKTHFIFGKFLSRKSCCLWDNVENYATAGRVTYDSILRLMQFTCWINEATDTHSEHVILIFARQQWSRWSTPLLCCTYIARLVTPHFCQPNTMTYVHITDW